jgi:tetratricopeptide (TPR) repeat protein
MNAVTVDDLLALLAEPRAREAVKRALDLPSEPVAEALRELREQVRLLAVQTDEGFQKVAAAQDRTDQAIGRLEAAQERTDQAIGRLEAAQERTDQAIGRLEAAQERTDRSIGRLEAAQERTDEAVRDLALRTGRLEAAQERTDDAVRELAAAQARTDQSIQGLRRDVGALSDNMGFGLEELASLVLPAWLEREEGVTVQRIARRYFHTAAGEEEVDLYADGDRAGTPVPVVGEVKSRIYSGDVKKYAVRLARIAESLPHEPLALMLGFVVHPAATDVARELGIRVLATRPSVR